MKRKNEIINIITFITVLSLFLGLSFYGCKKQESSPASKTEKAKAAEKARQEKQELPKLKETAQGTEQEEGYIYQPGDRRDPFIPLIAPAKKEGKKDGVRAGTLQSYDISEFVLLAIAQKGGKYFALLMTPDNRSFTVVEGTIIGLNKGRVEEITGRKIVLSENVKDYKGDLRPKQITLALLKER